MKIFLFQPSKNWSYCGGGMAVIADTFEEAVVIGSEDGERSLGVSEDELSKMGEESFDKWVLVASYLLQGDPPKGIVFVDENWG